MKPTLPLAAALSVIMVSTAVIVTLQTQTHSPLPSAVRATAAPQIISKIIQNNQSSQLELYLKLPPNYPAVNGFTLKAYLTNPDKPDTVVKAGPPQLNPELVALNWRFPMSTALPEQNQQTINLIGLSFAAGGLVTGNEPLLLATLPLDSKDSGQLVLKIDPENSLLSSQDGEAVFENAGIPIKI